jgi:hypothetical protein
VLAAVAGTLALAPHAYAATSLSGDRAAFLSTSTSATGPLPLLSSPRATWSQGDVTYRTCGTGCATDFWFKGWSGNLPGNELATGGVESFDLVLATPALAIGWDFDEPDVEIQPWGAITDACAATCIDSTFQVTLKRGTDVVGTQTYNAVDDTAVFIGITSDTPFDLVEIREIVGGVDNEFFGEIFTVRDRDADAVADATDNCADTANTDQADLDGDSLGDACDPDVDGDGVADAVDNCVTTPNADQLDSDSDGIGDVCDSTPFPPPPPPPPPPSEPTTKDECKNGGWASFTAPREFKNQGDCIQFVNTGK